MGCLGNILWFLFGGFICGLSWALAGCLWCTSEIKYNMIQVWNCRDAYSCQFHFALSANIHLVTAIGLKMG